MKRSLRLLLRKELRQFLRSRQAILTGLLLPTMLMVVAPMAQLFSARGAPAGTTIPTAIPGLEGVGGGVTGIFLYFTFPLFFVLAGLLTPSLAAVHTVISERERRSIELLIALPVSVRDILTAKLLANLTIAAASLLPLFIVDAIGVLVLTTERVAYLSVAFLLLLSALTASIGVSLLLALVARDFRTANNLNGAFVLPAMVLTGLCVLLVPGLARFVVLSILMMAMGAVAFWVAARWLTFERYLV